MGHDSKQLGEPSVVYWDSEKHYDLVEGWWRGHGHNPVDPRLLPCWGAIVCDEEGTPRCAGWLCYDSVNQIAHFDWMVSNPAERLTLSYGRMLFSTISEMAEKLGAVIMWAQVTDNRLARAGERMGFIRSGDNFTSLAYIPNS